MAAAQNEASSEVFRGLLTRLRENDPTLEEFDSEETIEEEEEEEEEGEEESRVWTNEEARALVGALMKNTVVTKVGLCVDMIPSQNAPAFVDYILLNPRLSELRVDMKDKDNYDEHTQRFVDELFHAVLGNPTMQKLSIGVVGTPDALFELLSTTKILTSLDFGRCLGEKIAPSREKIEEYGKALLSGLGQNLSLRRVSISDAEVDITVSVLSGLFRHPRLEQLSLKGHFSSPTFLACMTELQRLLESASNLKELQLNNADYHGEMPAGDFLLAQRKCTSLKCLTLENFDLTRASWLGSYTSSLESVELKSCRCKPSLRPLKLMAGLKDLTIYLTSFNTGRVSWAEMIRSKPHLRKLAITSRYSPQLQNDDLRSIVEALYGHKSIKELVIDSSEIEGGNAGKAVRLLLSNNTSLEKLELSSCNLRSAGATLLAAGLRSNGCLLELSLSSCTLETSGIIAVLSASQESKTLRRLVLDECEMDDESIGAALEDMLSNNNSLTSLSMSGCSLGSNVMHLAEGLKCNSSLKRLDMSDDNTLIAEHVSALGQALGSNTSLEAIDLGSILGVDGITTFFRSLPHMCGLKRLHFEDEDDVLNTESVALLLQALKTTNKTLESITGVRYPEGHVEEREEIDFYLKLNRYGRRLLRNPNVPSGLWPHILERMTGPSDVDALFYCLREAPKQLVNANPKPDRKRKANSDPTHNEEEHATDDSDNNPRKTPHGPEKE